MNKHYHVKVFLLLIFMLSATVKTYPQNPSWIFPRTSWYCWDQLKTTTYYKIRLHKDDAKVSTLCEIDKNRFSFGSLIFVNYEPMTQYICKNPLLGVKTVVMKGYASVNDPTFRNTLKLNGVSNHRIVVTMYLNEENYPSAMIFNFGKKCHTFCVFQNEEIAKAYWSN